MYQSASEMQQKAARHADLARYYADAGYEQTAIYFQLLSAEYYAEARELMGIE